MLQRPFFISCFDNSHARQGYYRPCAVTCRFRATARKPMTNSVTTLRCSLTRCAVLSFALSPASHAHVSRHTTCALKIYNSRAATISSRIAYYYYIHATSWPERRMGGFRDEMHAHSISLYDMATALVSRMLPSAGFDAGGRYKRVRISLRRDFAYITYYHTYSTREKRERRESLFDISPRATRYISMRQRGSPRWLPAT